MNIRFTFNREKAIAAILYIAKKLMEKRGHPEDFYKILKILYFAEANHLARHGLPIVGDHYVALQHGPVPSKSYNLVQVAKGDSPFPDTLGLASYFSVHGIHLTPLRSPDMDEFSESDINCLDESINENWALTFGGLKIKSHTPAYNHAGQNDEMDIAEIAADFGADAAMIESLKAHAENQLFLSGPLKG